MTELVDSIAANVIDKIGDLDYHEIFSAWGISKDLKKLQVTMSTIKPLLLDAEEKQGEIQDLSRWLGQLKDVFHDATDFLDEFECEALRRQVVETHGSACEKVCHFFSSSNPLALSIKMGNRVKEIRERFDLIAKDRDKFQLRVQPDDKRILYRNMSHSSDVIGRVYEKERIINLLLKKGDNPNVSVICIVGTGGMGKTTLAGFVYNDARVAKSFDLKIWLCVSEDFDVFKLAKEILKSACGGISGNMSEDDVQTSLRNILVEKRFLIVLDNVLNKNYNKWINLKNLLRESGQGSKILVTTRSHEVASIIEEASPKEVASKTAVPSKMAVRPIHVLNFFPHKECLALFLLYAFNEGEHEQNQNLLDFADEIVKTCKNVPLAVKTLGSLLYSTTMERDWISVLGKIRILERMGGKILPALRLSYDQLPSYLKQCFAYCSLYPKNFRYNSFEIIQSWMANGLLKKPKKSTEELEDIGEQYIKELSSRSFFQELVEEHDTFLLTFKMHGFFYDLSSHVAQNDYCIIENINNANNFENARHVSILDHKSGVDAMVTFLHKLNNNMRTINFSCEDWDGCDSININESLVETCISRFKQLRVLNLRFSTLKTLPSSISTLKQLRYLNLHGNKQIKELLKSICDLQNLETLILFGCEELEELPREIRKMVSLRYFAITTKQTHIPAHGIECMSSLRSLFFKDCPRLECFNEGIQRLTALRNLGFGNCKSLISLPQGTKHLTALEYLAIVNCEKINFEEGEDYPTRLRTLFISKLPQLVKLPSWLMDSANTLQYLEISHCENLVELPGWLPFRSSLVKLVIEDCPRLLSLPKRMDRLTALKELQIVCCPELEKNYRREVGKDWADIAHVPLVKFIS